MHPPHLVPRTSFLESGFVALVSVIIIGAVLIVLVFTLGVSTFFTRFSVLDAENKRTSALLAEGCMNAAMLKIAQNGSYAPAAAGECVAIGGTCGGSDPQRVCKICSVNYSGSTATIETRALYNGTYTNLLARVDTAPGNMAVTFWDEKPVSGASTCTLP